MSQGADHLTDVSKVLKTVSLCAGIGGIELGLSLVEHVEPLAFVESNKYCQKVLAARWPAAKIYPDVTQYSPEPCDLVTAGFPCQPFSCAGKQKGTNDERWIWEDIARIIRESGARRVFLENVPPLVYMGGLATVLRSLALLGFDAAWGVLSCASLGAPHVRKRLFILADAHLHGRTEQGGQRSRDSPSLRDLCELWPTPMACSKQMRSDREYSGKRFSPLLGDIVQYFPTPTQSNQGRDWNREDSLSLRKLIDHRFGPQARTQTGPDSNRGRPNTEFLEWMMGFPPAWSDPTTAPACAHWATQLRPLLPLWLTFDC